MNQSAAVKFKNITKSYRTAIYERLSKDDELAGDSTSIQNQRKILYNYASENGMNVIGEYTDDGWSGTNFNRPGFTKMIEDIDKKNIECIIVKDLSRLGRNYIEVGYYLENFFPSKGIRFIAISENVDTNKGDSDLVPFVNIFNEYHAKSTSKKLRQVHEMQSAEGACHYTYPPMGYNKDPENKKHLVIDEETSWIIEKIFELADVHGMGSYSIQKWLFENKVITPGYREYLRWGAKAKVYENASDTRKYEWGLANIKSILKNRVYLGHTVRYKNRTISFKNKKRVKYAPEDWIIKENTHDPLVAEDRFYRVQKQLESRRRKTNDGEVQMFSGIARCSQCGRLLRFATNRQLKSGDYQYLSCSSKDYSLVEKCTMHYIRYDTLQEIVLQKIQDLYQKVELDEQAIARKLSKMEKEKSSKAHKKERAELQKLETRRSELDKVLPRLYEDWVSEKITEDMFRSMSVKFQNEKADVDQKIRQIRETLSESEEELDNARRWISAVKKFSYPTELTHELVSNLIDKIIVHEAEGPKGSKNKTQILEIYWKFVGNSEVA